VTNVIDQFSRIIGRQRHLRTKDDAVRGVTTQNSSHLPDPLEQTAEAIRAAGPQLIEQPDDLTRARHIKMLIESSRSVANDEMTAVKATANTRKKFLHTAALRPLLAGAAAVALVAVAAVVMIPSGTEDLASGGPSFSTPAQAEATAASGAVTVMRTETAQEVAERAARTPSPVPFERTENYVILTVQASKVSTIQTELAQGLGAEPVRIGISDRATTFVVPASVAALLSDTEGLTQIADTPIKSFNDPIEQSPVPSWGLDRIDATDTPLDNKYSYISAGSGVRVYVIDTGIRADHADLSGRVGAGWSAIADDQGTNDCNGHGTHVAGTVAGKAYGVAKSAVVVPIRVLDCAGSGFTSSVISGINWVVANHPGGPAVINMSLGGPANSSLDRAVADASAAGFTVVAAAGNSNTDACSTSPARAPQALTIGATTSTDARASYSNYGPCVDLFAPGSSITSAWISSPTSTRTISGTSMAAPHVAGMAARLLQTNPGTSPSALATILTGSATTDTVSGTNGSVNLLANIVETPPADEDEEEVEEEAPEENPTEETPEETPEEVAPPTTEPRRPGNSGNSPGRNKKTATPKAFTLTSTEAGVAAQWNNDPEATRYRVECAINVVDALRYRPNFVLELMPDDATLLPNRQRQLLLPAEALTNSRCWLIAELDGAPSDPSNVELIPWATSRPGNSGNAPGLVGGAPGNSGNAPGLVGGAPGNSGNAPGNSGNVSTPDAPPPPTTVAPPAAQRAPGNAPGNSGNAPGRPNR